IGAAYFDELTKAHIFRYSNRSSYDTVYEDYDLLYKKFSDEKHTDDLTGDVNVPYFKGADRYVYDKTLKDYRMDKHLSPLDDSGITVAIGVRPAKQFSAAGGTEKLDREQQLGLSKGLIISLIPVGAVLFVIIIMLMVRCGYNRDTGTFTATKWLDKRFTAELFIIAAGAALTTFAVISGELGGDIDIAFGQKNLVFFLSYGLCVFLLWIIGFGSVLVMLRKLKTRTFLRTSAIVGLIKFTVKGISAACHKGEQRIQNTAYDKLSVAKKAMIRNLIFAVITGFVMAHCILCSLDGWLDDDDVFLTAVILSMYAIYFVWYFSSSSNYFSDAAKLCDKLDAIVDSSEYSGDDVSENSPFYTSYKSLDNLDEKVRSAAEEMVKSERTKVELVTNVSHDLKTPLTSIISYTYLLSKEEMSAEAKDYVQILKQKSEKLKTIVNDVFTLAKAASGAEVKNERLDLTMLVNQSLAGNQDMIDKSGITVKAQLPDTPVYIMGDGDKLSRVFQNLLDNALKYSLKGTRVYVEMTADGRAAVAFKNTSASEMNFTADEITERFTRGDKSRTDGGSGLGLSIAKTFTEACGGSFRIELEGDMFKAIAEFDITK
ncbi:MAG: HAMP domain-containing histidine kinase, partial [Ruminococcus sp.]|nr:HAMP domain-containing histidine kinase [Ruminococcus sp.]